MKHFCPRPQTFSRMLASCYNKSDKKSGMITSSVRWMLCKRSYFSVVNKDNLGLCHHNKNSKDLKFTKSGDHCEMTKKYKGGTSGETVMNVFDRNAKRLQRDRAALSYVEEDADVYDYLKDEFGYRLADRICDIKRSFKLGVDLGCGRGNLSKHLDNEMIETLFQCELSAEMLQSAKTSPEEAPVTHKLLIDEEFLPFKNGSLDIVVSNLSLHWVNDLPHCFRQVLQTLKNDGAFIGSMFGGETLYQLRVALQLAELEREGGFAPHISPFASVNDLGNLLTRAGFAMLTIDIDEVTINYPSMFELMYDLKGMAENNCSWNRKALLHRDTMIAAAAVYKELFGGDQGVPATFQVINFIGWKPDPSQPKAAKRGSGQVSIKDIHKLDQMIKEAEMKNEGQDDRPGDDKK